MLEMRILALSATKHLKAPITSRKRGCWSTLCHRRGKMSGSHRVVRVGFNVLSSTTAFLYKEVIIAAIIFCYFPLFLTGLGRKTHLCRLFWQLGAFNQEWPASHIQFFCLQRKQTSSLCQGNIYMEYVLFKIK